MSFLVLPIIGFTLSSAFEQKLARAIKNELSAYSYAILAVAEVENNKLLMPEQLMENQFNVIESGLYAGITELDLLDSPLEHQHKPSYLWQSYSLFSLNPPVILPKPLVGQSKFSEIILGGTKHFSFSLSVSFSTGINLEQIELSHNEHSSNELSNNISPEFPVTIHIIKDLRDFEDVRTARGF